ncbi:MAG: ATP-grasp domain-containing protein [Bdellovibrionales bacterium]|nr:ATP-grasp domain-containing protein [Bdellovibrionales bacterium]
MAKTRVGIVGGGQLAAMLGQAAYALNLEPVVLAMSSNEPGFKACRGSYLMTPGDAHAVENFLASVQVVTFENEFFSDDIVRFAGKYAHKFQPSLEAMALVRDKLNQKQLFAKLGLATAEFKEMGASENPSAWSAAMLQHFGGECVFKLATGGYDGRGVLVADQSLAAQAADFCTQARSRNARVYAEQKIKFRRELALISVRGLEGYSTSYPLVISEQVNGTCKLVTGPATSLGVPGALEGAASLMAGKIGVATQMTGAFGVEFFEDEQGKLWLNEVAPRVHNSGHYTLDASEASQFTNHWQAVLGMSLADQTTTVGAFAMLNLLGNRELGELMPIELDLPRGVTYYDYRKSKSTPGRKLGHLNGVVETVAELPDMIRTLKKCEQQWLEKLARQA